MTTDTGLSPDTVSRPRRTTPILGVIAVVVAVVALLLFLTRSQAPGDASSEAGFARDMGVHHAQAVEMSFVVRDKSTDGQIRTLAYDIITTQSTQRGIFMGWLQQWGLDQASLLPPMTWMAGHGGHGGADAATTGSMPGMASDEEMKRLKSAAPGKDAEVLFLQLMIRHHEGGVDMAEGLLKLSGRAEVRSLAQHIVDGQMAEIKQMRELLTDRGAQPLPSILRR
ncbi:DUF305 domain-containing protein [Sphaerimonospora cavernae]|uniref:DUF305 domain-containing protein n=1 Tax=Sphaerimonospora cavernae TaxID=1740611 RepID=A0ABV6TY71_9ACTN